MSYNKVTLNHSFLDSIVNTWEKQGKKYIIEVLGYVDGNGLNDEYGKKYPIRKAICKEENKVILERMERTKDCDCDDIIHSYIYDLYNFPDDWKIEIYVDDEEEAKF